MTLMYFRHTGVALLTIILISVVSPNTVIADTANTSQLISSEKHDFLLTKVVSGLKSPWSIAFLSDTDWLITEKSGALRRVVDGQLQKTPIEGIPKIKARGQGGLLDVVLDPDFDSNQRIYLSYVDGTFGKLGTEVLRAKLVNNRLENSEVIFKALPKTRGGRHFGSRLAFDDKGHLYISLGDRGERQNGQQLTTHHGALIRINPNGDIPADNPFQSTPGALPEIFSFGHRNIQGMAFDQSTKELWTHEHGPQGGDELNLIQPGLNYGWPVITYGANYGTGSKIGEGTHKPGMEQPITAWVPSIAPSGMTVYNGNAFKNWQGNLFVGALKFQLLVRLEIEQGNVINEERLLEKQIGRIRDVRSSPDGSLYLLTDAKNGAVYRLHPPP